MKSVRSSFGTGENEGSSESELERPGRKRFLLDFPLPSFLFPETQASVRIRHFGKFQQKAPCETTTASILSPLPATAPFHLLCPASLLLFCLPFPSFQKEPTRNHNGNPTSRSSPSTITPSCRPGPRLSSHNPHEGDFRHHFSPLHNKETLQSTLEGLLHGVMDNRRGPIRWSLIQKAHKPERHQLLGKP